jgi:hypothetical protein
MKQFRIVRVGNSKDASFKVQEKGWFFWRTWKRFESMSSEGLMHRSTVWFDTEEEAKASIDRHIAHLLIEENDKSTTTVTQTLTYPFA